jgi:GT2 family glycosyltransferase
MKSNPLVTINIVVLNGEKYIRECLNCVRNQTYKNIEVQIFDNGSTDRTKEIAREFPEFKLIESRSNLGMWPGQEKALETSNGDYIVALSVDVMLHTQFIEKGLTAFESNPRIGALQAKIYSYRHEQLTDGSYQASRAIDTCGFRIERSRRVTNIGHGQHDSEQFVHPREIFAVEGAVPFFRREALDAVQIGDHIIDHD